MYTPRYIVDYIVKNTVGKLLEGKTPAEASELKVVNPRLRWGYRFCWEPTNTCWTGTSNITWSTTRRALRGKSPALVPDVGAGVYRLSTAERKRILVNSIYGVDIDAQAVEVTKLSPPPSQAVGAGERHKLTLGFERVSPRPGAQHPSVTC